MSNFTKIRPVGTAEDGWTDVTNIIGAFRDVAHSP